MVLRERHCAELELAASPEWRRHSSVLLQHGEPVTWRAIEKWGRGMELGRFISGFFLFCFFLFCFGYFFWFCSPREDFSDSSPVSRCLSGSTNILSWFKSINACVSTRVYCTSSMQPLSLWYSPFSFSPTLCPLAAKLLCSTQLYHFCRVEWKKGKAGIL